MAIFAGSNGDRILESRRVAALREQLNSQLSGRLGAVSSAEAAGLYGAFADSVATELTWEEEFIARLEGQLALFDQLPAERFAKGLTADIDRLAAEHFRRRSSVVAIHRICNDSRDRIIRRALSLSLERNFGGSVPRFALLASGDVGRREQTLLPEHVNFYLVYDSDSTEERQRWEAAARSLGELLAAAGITVPPHDAALSETPWVGPPDRFVLESGDTCLGGDERADFPFLPDLRGMAGDGEFATALTDTAIGIIREHPEFFARRAKRAATLPVATSLFGWYRIERTGQHRGEFDLQQYTLTPLIRNVCVLALKRRVRQFCTIDRIKGLQSAGGLGVDLAEKLLAAYHEFMVQKIRKQLESFDGTFRGYFLDPQYLSEEEEDRFRNGLEAVVTLQKQVYQQMVGQM